MVLISGVDSRGVCGRAGIAQGDRLVSINGHEIGDVLDYNFYAAERNVSLTILRGGKTLSFELTKPEYDDLGLEFETYLMDKQRSCANRCIFCFIDQNPPNMRESIYFKDDDTRLSFLLGNYVTLTNMSEHDIRRIAEMHISPVNISVQTTNPELRARMLRNKNAGKINDIMKFWADHGIEMKCQIVVCPGWNDGDELRRSLRDLFQLTPHVTSVSVVPVGLTKWREGLEKLSPVTPEIAREILQICDEWGKIAVAYYNSRIFYASDEFYLTAGLPLPPPDYYDGFPQIENGVGMLASLEDEFMSQLRRVKSDRRGELSVATGFAACPTIKKLADAFSERVPHVKIHVYRIRNDFFGDTVTVAGLMTGRDIAAQLEGLPLGSKLLIPQNALRSGEDVFLDDMTVEELSEKLGTPVLPVECDGACLADAFLDTNTSPTLRR